MSYNFQNKFSSENAKRFASQNAIYIVLIVLVGCIAAKDINFLSPDCMRDILLQSSVRIFIALGAAFVLITGGVDLSAGRVVGLTAVLSGSMLQTESYARRFFPELAQIPIFIPIIIAIIAGIGVGLVNGLIVSKLRVPPFIATLGTMVAVYGLNSLYYGIKPNESQPIAGLRKEFTDLGSGGFEIGLPGDYVFKVPVIILFAVTISIIVWVVFNKTPLGKNMYAIGGNKEAARVSGINVGRCLLVLYAIAGALYAMGGILEAARNGGATNEYGNMYELDAIAACVVGGVSTTGGIGTVPGIVTGVLIFSVINYGLTFLGVDPNWQLMAKGAIIVGAVAFDIRKYHAKK